MPGDGKRNKPMFQELPVPSSWNALMMREQMVLERLVYSFFYPDAAAGLSFTEVQNNVTIKYLHKLIHLFYISL